MSLTVTNYLSKINREFPIRGQQNNSQIFRDNWNNIYQAISILNSSIDNLSTASIKINDLINLNGNIIENVNLKNYSTELYSLDTQNNIIEIDYELGAYQKFDLESGNHEVFIKNWPLENKTGHLFLSISSLGSSIISFNQGESLGFEKNQYILDQQTNYIFEIWNEGKENQYFVKLVNFSVQTLGTATSLSIYEKLEIGEILNSNQRNVFTVNTETNKNLATVVTRSTSTVKVGEISLVPNRITKVLRGATINSGSTATLTFDTITDLKEGSWFYLPINGNTTRYSILSPVAGSTTSIIITPNNFSVGSLSINTSLITFTNPTFNDQSTLMTLAATAANTSTGSKSNYVGSVYANKNRLEVTYQDYENNQNNTFVVQVLSTSTETSYVNSDVVPTSFFHSLLPVGSIVIWFGRLNDIPYGWTLCDGRTVETIVNGEPGPPVRIPDLRDKFIVAGKEDYYDSDTGLWSGALTTITATSTVGEPTGGYTDAFLKEHTHTASFVGNLMDKHGHPGGTSEPHNHAAILSTGTYSGGIFNTLLVPPYDGSLTGVTNAGHTEPWPPIGGNDGADILATSFTFTTSVSGGNGSAGTPAGTVDVNESGTGTEYLNIPPFIASFYIIKISGDAYANSGILS